VRDAATGRVRVRAFRLDPATGGRVDVASGAPADDAALLYTLYTLFFQCCLPWQAMAWR